MESWGVVFLGVIAVTTLVQAAFMVGLALGGLRLFRRVEELQTRIDRELKPTLDHLSRITRNVAEVTDLATLQARRIDYFLADTVDKLEDLTSAVRNVVSRPLGPLADVLAFVKGLRKGIDAYRQLGGFESSRRRGGASSRAGRGRRAPLHLVDARDPSATAGSRGSARLRGRRRPWSRCSRWSRRSGSVHPSLPRSVS